MTNLKTRARRVGLLYLVFAVVVAFNFAYLQPKVIVPGDPAATAHNLVTRELTYRTSILAGLAGEILSLFVVLGLYGLFRDVDRALGRLMVVVLAVGAAFNTALLLPKVAALILVSGAGFLAAFDAQQLDAAAYGMVRLHSDGSDLSWAFAALWLFPMGRLAMKSRFIPRVIGLLLIVGGVAYLALCGATVLLPARGAWAFDVLMPFYAIGELAFILWLVVMGARVRQTGTPTSSAI